MAKPKKEKPTSNADMNLLVLLAKKIKIQDERATQMRVLIDELEERIMELENAVFEEKRPHFVADFDVDDFPTDD